MPEGLSDFQKAEKDNPSVSLPAASSLYTREPYSMTQSVISSVRIFRPSRVISAPVSAPVSSRQSVALSPSGPVKAAEDETQYSIVPCVSAASMRCGAPQRMLAALTQGTMEYCVSSSAAFTGPDGESATLWRDETGALTGAEITRDGRKILTLEITDWVME